MRVLIDTNVLFSALLFPHSTPAKVLLHVARNHEIVLTDRNITELRDIVQRKKPDLLPAVENLLAELSFELIPTIGEMKIKIRDVKDQPILNAAILADVDMILTGDKDFLCLETERPKCMTPGDFAVLEKL